MHVEMGKELQHLQYIYVVKGKYIYLILSISSIPVHKYRL